MSNNENSELFAQEAKRLVADIAKARALLKSDSPTRWRDILDFADLWALRHEPNGYSTKEMSDEDLQACVIEDLLFTHFEKTRNIPEAHYPLWQTTRHLGARRHRDEPRIQTAISALMEKGMLDRENGVLTIPQNQIESAQDFCGVYHDLQDPDEDDVFDTMVQAGGLVLATDVFTELLETLEEEESIGPKL